MPERAEGELRPKGPPNPPIGWRLSAGSSIGRPDRYRGVRIEYRADRCQPIGGTQGSLIGGEGLRQKIETDAGARYLITASGIGYALQPTGPTHRTDGTCRQFLFGDQRALNRGDILGHEWLNGGGEVVRLLA